MTPVRVPPYLSLPQVSRVLRGAIPERTLRHRASKGRIKAHDGGYACKWLVPAAEVYRLAAELGVEPDWRCLDDG